MRAQGNGADQQSGDESGRGPEYVIHHVEEKDVTVDWFFGAHHSGTKVTQLVLVLVGWFFALLPVVITISALVHRNDEGQRGWWGYHEGFVMWETTMVLLGILFVLFVVGFLMLHVLDVTGRRDRDRTTKTYDQERLALRLEVAEDWYAGKFGPQELRQERTRVEIQPYGDIETYELRGLYRTHDID